MIGPVIDADARRRILDYQRIAGPRAGSSSTATRSARRPGLFRRPADRRRRPAGGTLAQEEIFGPVLAVLKANDFDDALLIANATPYALTGGLYSRGPAHIEQATRQFRVGNLYINRTITGAWSTASRSAASSYPASAPRPAGPITCSISC